VLLFAAAFGQALPNRQTFEVAAVRPSVVKPAAGGSARSGGDGVGGGGGCPQRLKIDQGRVSIECATLPMLIAYAFRLSPGRVTGPAWMMGVPSPRFDIAAKIPQGASENQVPDMVGALLADRFRLASHQASASQEIYALVVAKGGLKMKKATSDAGAPPAAADPDSPGVTAFSGETLDRMTPNADGKSYTTTISGPRIGTVREIEAPGRIQRLDAPAITLSGLTDLLDRIIPSSTPVADMTGLKERYQLLLELSLGDLLATRNDDADRDEAILKVFNDGLAKLGLRLERRKGPVETLIVDHVEKTPTEN